MKIEFFLSINQATVSTSLLNLLDQITNAEDSFSFFNVKEQRHNLQFVSADASADIIFQLSGDVNKYYQTAPQIIPLLAEFAGFALFLYLLGDILMGLHAHRMFLRSVINRTFHIQKDNGDLLQQFEIMEETATQLRRTLTPSQVSPAMLGQM